MSEILQGTMPSLEIKNQLFADCLSNRTVSIRLLDFKKWVSDAYVFAVSQII